MGYTEHVGKYSQRWMSRAYRLLMVAVIAAGVHAQDAAFIDRVLESAVITAPEVAYILSIARGEIDPTIPFEDYPAADPDAEPLSYGGLAIMLAEMLGAPTGPLYAITGLGRYAVRDLRDEEFLPTSPRFSANRGPVSGAEALRLIADAISELGDPESYPADYDIQFNPPPGRGAQTWSPRAEVDLFSVSALSWNPATPEVPPGFSQALNPVLRAFVGTGNQVDATGLVSLTEDGFADATLDSLSWTVFLEPEVGADNIPVGPATQLRLGRIAINDGSGVNAPVALDGASIQLIRGLSAVTLGAGYTGLLPLSPALAERPGSSDSTAARVLGDGRLNPGAWTGVLSLVFPEALGRQSPGITVFASLDEDSFSPSTERQRYDSLQLSLSAAGSLNLRQFYGIVLTGATGRYQSLDATVDYLGFLGAASWRWFPSTAVPMRLQLGAVVSSGQRGATDPTGTDGSFTIFRGYVGTPAIAPWTLYGGLATNVAAVNALLSVRAAELLLTEARIGLLSRVVPGATGEAALDTASDNLPLGMELGVRFLLDLAREMNADLKADILIPATVEGIGAFAAGTPARVRVTATLNLQL